jgi:hypothetical protein
MTAPQNTPDKDKKPQENGVDKKPVPSGRKSAKEMLAEGYTHEQLLAMGYHASEIGIKETNSVNVFAAKEDANNQKHAPEKPKQKQNENTTPQHQIQAPEIKLDLDAKAAKPDATRVESQVNINKPKENEIFYTVFTANSKSSSPSNVFSSSTLSTQLSFGGKSFYNQALNAISGTVDYVAEKTNSLLKGLSEFGKVQALGGQGNEHWCGLYAGKIINKTAGFELIPKSIIASTANTINLYQKNGTFHDVSVDQKTGFINIEGGFKKGDQIFFARDDIHFGKNGKVLADSSNHTGVVLGVRINEKGETVIRVAQGNMSDTVSDREFVAQIREINGHKVLSLKGGGMDNMPIIGFGDAQGLAIKVALAKNHDLNDKVISPTKADVKSSVHSSLKNPQYDLPEAPKQKGEHGIPSRSVVHQHS